MHSADFFRERIAQLEAAAPNQHESPGANCTHTSSTHTGKLLTPPPSACVKKKVRRGLEQTHARGEIGARTTKRRNANTNYNVCSLAEQMTWAANIFWGATCSRFYGKMCTLLLGGAGHYQVEFSSRCHLNLIDSAIYFSDTISLILVTPSSSIWVICH